MSASPYDLAPGSRINDWCILGKARQGRVGRVFTVFRENRPDHLFVLKLLRADRADDDAKAIPHEARLLKAAKATDYMPTFVDEGTWQGLPYFVMERLEEIAYPIPARDYRTYCVKACEALAELHEADILHCDITPLHLVRKNGHYAFLDFDNARTHFAASAHTDHCIGTAPYIAPEVASQGILSEQSDIYSLARILLEHCPKGLKTCFEPTLTEAMSPAPKDRPSSASELAERLRTCRAPHHRFRSVFRALTICTTIFLLCMVGSYLYRATHTSKRVKELMAIETLVRTGVYNYQNCDFGNAFRNLDAAMRSEFYNSSDFPNINVKGLHDDSLERMQRGR